MMKPNIILSVAASNTGKVREKNEDNFYLNGKTLDTSAEDTVVAIDKSKKGLFAVCDGMGGEAFGELASAIAVDTLGEGYKKMQKHKRTFVEMIDSYSREANEKICEEITKHGGKRLGTTFVVLYIEKNTAYVCNIGDSRAYLYRDKHLTQLSKDHTQIRPMIEMGILTKERAKTHPERHKLTQHFGIFPEEMEIELYHVEPIPVQDNDVFVLCSDGLTDMVEDKEIERIIRQHRDLKSIAKELVNAALSSGGKDNVTVMISRIRKQKSLMKWLSSVFPWLKSTESYDKSLKQYRRTYSLDNEKLCYLSFFLDKKLELIHISFDVEAAADYHYQIDVDQLYDLCKVLKCSGTEAGMVKAFTKLVESWKTPIEIEDFLKNSDIEYQVISWHQSYYNDFNLQEYPNLSSPEQLPDIDEDNIIISLREEGPITTWGGCKYIVLYHGETELWREVNSFEFYNEYLRIGRILKTKYGSRLSDFEVEYTWALGGDSSSAFDKVTAFRKALSGKGDISDAEFDYITKNGCFNPKNAMFWKALEFAKERHAGQLRDEGTEYFEHIESVIEILRKCGHISDYIFTIAALHDILEDTETTRDELYALLSSYPNSETIAKFASIYDCDHSQGARMYDLLNNKGCRDVIAEVELLTHRSEDTFKTYIDRIFQDDSIKREEYRYNGAKYVKLADRLHNLSTLHLCGDPEKIQRKILETEEFIMPWRDKHISCEKLFALIEEGLVLVKERQKRILEEALHATVVL